MATSLGIHIIPGTPIHLEEDCPNCGWADLWRVEGHMISPAGVSTIGVATRCVRCGYTPSRGSGS